MLRAATIDVARARVTKIVLNCIVMVDAEIYRNLV